FLYPLFFFFLPPTATTQIYTLSLHDALPISVFWTISFPIAWPGLLAGIVLAFARGLGEFGATLMLAGYIPDVTDTIPLAIYFARSEEHTSELQSRFDLVCRLLLEKKKKR